MEENFIQNKDSFPETHYFIYKEKRYPIKYGFFKLSSKYFSKNSAKIKKNKDIQLIDSAVEQNIDLSEKSIIDFIKYVHREPISLTRENATDIDYLAQKYEVSSLSELTTNYITLHHEDLAIQILKIHQNDPTFTTEMYENAISEHFLNSIQDENLLTIPIPTLYRIFSKYQEKAQNSEQNSQKIFDFLLKCLDKHGREASVLFSQFDFGNSKSSYLNLLLTKYSEIFDFNFVSFEVQKTIYEQQSSIIQHEIENRNKQEELQNQMEIQKQENMAMKDEIEKLKNENKNSQEKLQNQIKLELERIRADYARELELQEHVKKDEVSKIKSEFEKEINSLKSEIKEQRDKLEQMSKQLNEKDENNRKKAKELISGSYFEFDGNEQNRFHGIIHHLTKVFGGNVHEKGIVNVTSLTGTDSVNAVDLNNAVSYFQSRDGNKQNQWLKYDFKDIKIRPTHYSVRSRPDGKPGFYNPQTWVIEGSNTGSDNDWEMLDSQNEVNYLDGASLSHTFQIEKKLPSNKFFRFVRFRQTGRNTGNDYDLRLSALEYFGYIQE